MRKPRDIDAELKALAEKAEGAAPHPAASSCSSPGQMRWTSTRWPKESDPQEKEVWRSEGAAFFLSRRRKALRLASVKRRRGEPLARAPTHGPAQWVASCQSSDTRAARARDVARMIKVQADRSRRERKRLGPSPFTKPS